MAAIHAGIHQICDFSLALQATLLFRRGARACAVEKVFFALLAFHERFSGRHRKL
jgi:hypothetical protein